MSRMLAKMNLISVVQQLPKEDIELVQNCVEMIEEENQELKEKIEKIRGIVENSDWRLDDVHDLIDGYDEIAKIII